MWSSEYFEMLLMLKVFPVFAEVEIWIRSAGVAERWMNCPPFLFNFYKFKNYYLFIKQ